MEDHFLYRLKHMDKPVVFYGDPTYFMVVPQADYLFPDIFLRSETVNSFNIKDFVEVKTKLIIYF